MQPLLEGRFGHPYRYLERCESTQRLLADDCVHAFLYQPQWVTVAHKNLRGLWKDMPIFVNDVSALSWA